MNEKTGGEKPDQPEKNLGRRKFIGGASAVATAALLAACGKKEEPAKSGAAPAAAPAVAVKPSTVTFKMQGAWGAKDIFNEMAEEYVKRVNEMAEGRLRIDYLTAGAVVKPFEVMDAVNKGVLDAGHHVPVYWYGKSKVASLFGSGPINGCDAQQTLAWIYRGGGFDLYNELLKKLELDVVGYFCMPMPTQPLGWFKKPVTSAADMVGLKYRTVGLAADLMQEMGLKVTQLPGGEIVPAMERGVIDAFEFNNPTSDMRFGAQDVAKNYMMGSFHQAMEFFEIIFNRKKHDALPKDLQAILRYGAEAASASNWWTAMDNYSRDLDELANVHKVNVIRTPKSIFEAQLKAWDVVSKRLSDEDPFFKKVVESQRAWSKRVARYWFINDADFKLGYEHIHGKLGF
ncbi:MAG: TRAP transporter substrate-binding protein [Sterolibacteriaceae bacterium]|uniref:TRAP transporter substrate-binding protein n=1 Tax=Candidatus Methylophosphatis roskildensis TaxID=2899263 RepID=A0A9D7E3X3_9PROT|nr:TRAP transporter substrate-binding protein [Candidatus Methylophosphatis roskildensis]MBK7236069.1 TRAP transporter substrate-binding protein [Sterolibacteriaceae bacterium]